MQNLEAFMLDVLLSVSLDVLSEEFKTTLVSFDWVAQIIFVHNFLVISQEGSNGFDAGGTLQILAIDHFVQVFF